MLRLKNIIKDYAALDTKVRALKGVSLNFRESEFVSVLGPSGCGKTTLLNIIGGLDKYTSGDMVINSTSTKDFSDHDWDVFRNHRVGFIFQSYNLIPHQTVLGNVELALTISGISKSERRERARAALEKVGLSDQINKRPNQLSGGQSQRVAIARALVNDPEILLADEPTGALDSKTSVQIMNLVKEISKERLVIMVTHNSELAEEYSTRIIRLLDGSVVADSNPYGENQAKLDIKKRQDATKAFLEQMKEEKNTDSKKPQAVPKGYLGYGCLPPDKSDNYISPDSSMAAKIVKSSGNEKAKMGFFTAFMLSLRNLLTKKGRTFMTIFAGSIGIIGVAVVLAFSSGISAYISQMENDMMSGFPVYVASSAYDFDAILNLTNLLGETDEEKHDPNKVYLNKVLETLTELNNITIKNDITKEYVDYIGKMPAGTVETVRYSYGTAFANNIYTDMTYGVTDGDTVNYSITGIRAIFTQIIKSMEEYRMYASMINSVASFVELPDSESYILSQYDVMAGEYPRMGDKNSLVLVLSADDKVDDMLIAQMGYVPLTELANYSYSMIGDGGNEYFQPDLPHLDKTFDYSEFVGENAKTFTWYPNSVVFENTSPTSFRYHTEKQSSFTDGVDMSVACILKPKAGVTYGSLSSGMYFTKALSDHVRSIELNEATQSNIVKFANSNDDKVAKNIKYGYTYYLDEKDEATQVITRNVKHTLTNEDFGDSPQSSTFGDSNMLDQVSSMFETKKEFIDFLKAQLTAAAPGFEYETLLNLLGDSFYASSDRVVSLAKLGGEELPNRMNFYTSSYEMKQSLLKYLDAWNDLENGYIKSDVEKIQYTDTIGSIMGMVNMLVGIITIALVAFTSLALVVSTVMIAIITYVSVVERIKEIGVIRAIGGRKKDVRNLFMAETFMLGLGSGIVGIGVTYLISGIFNLIMGLTVGIFTIAALHWSAALILIAVSVLLTFISGLLPASSAARKDPVVALRTE